jgi:uncharacterized integral membrane protein
MGFIRWILGFFIAAAIAVLAVSNRHTISISLTPVTGSFEIPLYSVVLMALAAGFILGALTVWMNGAPVRRMKRRQRRHIKELEKQLEAVNENALGNGPPADFFPALPVAGKSSKQ